MNILINIGLSLAVTLLSVFGIYNYVPLRTFESIKSDNKLGVSLTTINGGDTISGSRTVINNNFTALDNGKIENSTTSIKSVTTLENLASIGTITTGTWTAGIIGSTYGGTGTSSPSQYRVLLGNAGYGITVASSTGTTGQFLVSNGSSAYPSWQTSSIDQSLDYNFTGTNFLVKNFSASSTAANPIKLNGVSLNTPNTNGASSTILKNDGSGNLTWGYPQATTTYFVTAGSWTWVRPAGVSKVKVRVQGGGGGGGGCGGSCSAGTASKTGGGGAGGYAEAMVFVSGDVTVTVGAAGVGDNEGTTVGTSGGASSFAGNITVSAAGGTVGTDRDSGGFAAGGAGGGTTNASLGITGQAGRIGSATLLPDGGTSHNGFGGKGGDSGENGADGVGYGSGGGGGAGTNSDGGAGGGGFVIVEVIQ